MIVVFSEYTRSLESELTAVNGRTLSLNTYESSLHEAAFDVYDANGGRLGYLALGYCYYLDVPSVMYDVSFRRCSDAEVVSVGRQRDLGELDPGDLLAIDHRHSVSFLSAYTLAFLAIGTPKDGSTDSDPVAPRDSYYDVNRQAETVAWSLFCTRVGTDDLADWLAQPASNRMMP